ncbi:MAG: hypothetical protein R6V23_04260 [Bacteroidales bacterium]
MKKLIVLIVILISIVKISFAQYIYPVAEYRNDLRNFELSNFDIQDTVLYLPLGEHGLQIIDISDIHNFQPIATYEEFERRSRKKVYGTAYCVKVIDNKAFLSYGELGLKILNISDPTMPFVMGTYYRHQDVYCTKIYKNFALLGYVGMGLEIVDFSNMNDIRLASRNNVKDFSVNNIQVLPPYVMISGGRSGLRTFKFGEPFTEFKQAEFPKDYITESEAHQLLVYDKTGYIANDFKGLLVLNMGLPLYPLKVNEIKTIGKATNLMIDRSFLYVTTDKGIDVFDIQEPEKPVKIFEHIEKDKEFKYLKMHGDYLYALFEDGKREYGIEIFQVE